MEKFLRSNNVARILAVFLALILWLFITGDEITRTTPSRKTWQEIPLLAENLGQNFVVTEIPPSIDMTLEGLPEFFDDLTVHDIEVFVDLTDKVPGTHLIGVQARPPRGLSLISLEPEKVRVVIELYISGEFTVEIESFGEPAGGWVLKGYTIDPQEVLVGAPESLFMLIDRVVMPINISDMRFTEVIELQPVALDNEGRKLTGVLIDPISVTVHFEFERIPEPESVP